MGGTEGQIYIPLGRKEEGKVDMVQQKSHGSHGKRAKLAIGLICGVALLAGMALLTHRIVTGRSGLGVLLCQILLSACRKFTFSILHTLSIAQPLL